MNKVILIGNLGADPESRITTTGKDVCNLSLATTSKWKNKDGELQEKTEWHRVTIWGKTAEIAQKYLSKGRQVCIEGHIEYSKSEQEDGTFKYYTDIVCDRLELLGKGNGNGSTSQPADPNAEDVPF
jgi:single-strand DNA-binding protein